MYGTQKSAPTLFQAPGRFFCISNPDRELRLRGRTNGADFGASTAFHAHVGINLVLGVALGDRVHRAALGACAAHDASIRNLVSHAECPPCESYTWFINALVDGNIISRIAANCKPQQLPLGQNRSWDLYYFQIQLRQLLAPFPFWRPLIPLSVALLRCVSFTLARMKNSRRILAHSYLEIV
jgi:hypothetical protein